MRETLIEKRLFTGLEPLVQERLFAPTCFSEELFSSGNLVSYVESFVSRPWHEFDPNHPSMLLFVFPCLEASAWRIETVTGGYLSFCSEIEDWHTPSMHARLVVAPVEPDDENEKLPLETTAGYVRDLLP